MKALIFAAAAILLPFSCMGATLDAALSCTVSAHEFIHSLEEQGLIDPQPMRVESNSINAFNPAHNVKLVAFGFSVFAVVGFQKNDPMFQTGDGEPVANSAYGAVVFGGLNKVRDAVKAANSPAIAHHVAPFITAIFCKID